jgi:nucleolar protein 9
VSTRLHVLQEKITRSLIPQESFLAGSRYGKYFARSLNLYLLQKRPEEWKDLQAAKAKKEKGNAPSATSKPAATTQPAAAKQAGDPASLKSQSGEGTQHGEKLSEKTKKKRKREESSMDEIDEVFANAFGKKVKKGVLAK